MCESCNIFQLFYNVYRVIVAQLCFQHLVNKLIDKNISMYWKIIQLNRRQKLNRNARD